jgi:hypothetical protein
MTRTYWARSGVIHTHGRIMTDADAGALLEVYLDEAIAAYVAREFDAWAEAAGLAIELNRAIWGARRHRVTGSRPGVALMHLDGNPHNNSLENLRAVRVQRSSRSSKSTGEGEQ